MVLRGALVTQGARATKGHRCLGVVHARMSASGLRRKTTPAYHASPSPVLRMNAADDPWGETQTQFFHALTPDRILDAVEDAGFQCTGRVMALNSMENRVYDVEIEVEGDVRSPSERFRVVKFYRPGRWSVDQIADEHDFLLDLVEEEIPAVAPLDLGDCAIDGVDTLAETSEGGILYAVFPRVGGRIGEEFDDESLRRMGRLVARVHSVGVRGSAPDRIRLDPDTYGRGNLEYLLEANLLPESVRERYASVVRTICDIADPWFAAAESQRIHGDCHLGNVLTNDDGMFLVDFDDMVRGPCVQDLWLIEPGIDDWALGRREVLLEGYEQLRDFDRSSLKLIPPLRALRMVHFSAWIARRFEDPSFQRIFTDFGSERYWFEEVTGIQEQLGLMQEQGW